MEQVENQYGSSMETSKNQVENQVRIKYGTK
jgi:hypothetical protein